MGNGSSPRDSLFQLNTLVWASFPQPSGSPVTPVLRNAGYVLYAIEQPLTASVAEAAQLKRLRLDVQPNPVADAVLHNQDKNAYVLVECKPSSFGPDSYECPQARGMIVAGANVASRLGLSRNSVSEVCYLVPAGDAGQTDATLLSLLNQVSGHGLAGCPTGVVGLFLKPDGVYLGLEARLGGKASMPLQLIPQQLVVSRAPDQDPRPLYVIPWIPDAQDGADLAAFKEKVRVVLLSWLGKTPVGSPVLPFEEVLHDVTRGVFRQWADKQSLLGRVLPTLEKLVRSLFGDDIRANIGRRQVSALIESDKDREELMERVRTAALPERLPKGIQLPLQNEDAAQ